MRPSPIGKSMEEFKTYMRSSEAAVPGTEVLKKVVEQWPWFTTARVLLAAKEVSKDPRLTLPLMCRPAFGVRLREVTADEFLRRSTGEIIDDFLKRGEYKIVPQEGTPEPGPQEEERVEDDELVTEELAEIYLAQGLCDEAVGIYRKLSLLYPEKSVYFAEIIGRIGNKTE